MSGKRDRTAGAKECRTEQRTVFVALEDYAAQADIVPGNPDVLVGSGHLPAHPTSWSARWAFAAIGDATYVVPVQGGACDR